MGCYFVPDNTWTIESVVAALKERPWGAKLLVAGDFNAKLSEPEGDQRGENMAAALATEGLEDMLAHLLLLRSIWCRDGSVWIMIWKGREVRYQTDYILGTDCRLFCNVSVRDPRNSSYQQMVLGCNCTPPPPLGNTPNTSEGAS